MIYWYTNTAANSPTYVCMAVGWLSSMDCIISCTLSNCVEIFGKHAQHYSKTMRQLRKQYFDFLSNLMGYDRGDSFPFDFEPNGIPFGSENR